MIALDFPRRRSLLLAAAFCCFAVTGSHAFDFPWPFHSRRTTPKPSGAPANVGDARAAESAMLALVNSVRVEHGLSRVVLDPTLSAVARDHSKDMSTLGFFDHKSPVPGKRTTVDRLARAGINDFRHVSENIAFYPYRWEQQAMVESTGRGTPQDPNQLAREMMRAYLQSRGHRENLLDPQVHRVGLGFYIAGENAYNTQVFKD